MSNPVQALRALQEIDRDLYRVSMELKRLPAERDRRLAELAQREQRIEDERARAREFQVRVKEIENVTSTQRDRIRKLEKEASTSRDMAVVEGCRYEVRSLRRQIDDAERDALNHMEAVETGQERTKALVEELAAERAVFAEFDANVEVELADAKARLNDLVARRSARLGSDVVAETLTLYERLLTSRAGEAMAHLESGICQGCFMEVPRNLWVHLARGTTIIQCPSCDRILYL